MPRAQEPMTRVSRTVRVRSDNFSARPATAAETSARAPRIRSMVSVVIAALSGTASIGTAGLMDALNKADLSQALRTGRPASRVFDVRPARRQASYHPLDVRRGAGAAVSGGER